MPLYKAKVVEWKSFKESFKETEAAREDNYAQLERIDTEAKERGELLWRYIQEGYADGHAIYQIIRVNKTSVRIHHCFGFGDDWMIPYWGEEASVNIEYAETSVQSRDKMAAFFSA